MHPLIYFQLYFGKSLRESTASPYSFYFSMGVFNGINTVMMNIADKKQNKSNQSINQTNKKFTVCSSLYEEWFVLTYANS